MILLRIHITVLCVKKCLCRDNSYSIGVNLTLNGRLETASTQAEPTQVGFKQLIFRYLACVAVRNRIYTGKTHPGGFPTINFSLVREGGLCLYSRNFQLLGLSLNKCSYLYPNQYSYFLLH